MNNRLLILLTIVTLVLSGYAGYSRTGQAIRTTGDNLNWESASTWIVIQTGQTGLVTPQPDDTIYVAHKVLLNQDFELSAGQLFIETTGSITSATSSLVLSNRSEGQCSGCLTISDFKLLTQSSFQLMSAGKVTINGNFLVADDCSYFIQNQHGVYGSLITNGSVQGNISEEVNVEANITRLVSSPVNGAESGVFLNMYLRNYNEQNANWGEYIVPTTSPLNPMQGYEVLSLYNDVREFAGTPLSGEQRIDITASGDGWNLIGNPYPSSINWNLLGSGNDAGMYPQGVNTIYYKDDSGSGNYSIFCPGDEPISINSGSPVIKPMQGFFIKADNHSNISVTNEMRTHSTGNESIAQLPFSAIGFRVEGNNYSDEAVIRFNPDASEKFDVPFDAYKLQGLETAPGIFFPIEDGSKLSLNTLGDISSGLVVPFQVTTPYQGSSILKIKGATEFQYRYPVYLEDVSTGVYIDLRSQSEYSFESSIENPTHLFRLHFSSPGGIPEVEDQSIKVISGEASILISDTEARSGNVEVFSVDGKRLYSLENTSLQTLTIPVASGMVYITRIITNTGKVKTCKLFCR